MSRVIIVISTIISIMACGSDKYTGPQRSFTNAEFNIGFNIPQGWEKADASQIPGAIALYKAPKIENNFQANLNLIITKLSKDEQGKNLLDLALEELKTLEGFRKIKTETIVTDANETCQILTYKFTFQNLKIQGMQVYLADKKHVAILTFTALESNFGKYKPEFIKCGKSLCFGN